MVRLKQRYILFEILQPPQAPKECHEDRDLFTTFAESPSTGLLTLHRSSPSSINPKAITNSIKQHVQEYYGDFGAGFLMTLNVKYFNNKTSTGIIRCGNQNFQYVLGAMTLINKIESKPVIIRCTHVSGTIKKCEQFASQKNRELIRCIEVDQKRARGKLHTI
ncbi:RNA-binding protein pop5 [Yamadazyma tenuis]|uniref:Ribonuclease P/MRP protein subunit POP5 n=1 Tax=Candida tenuis (strain ATCC 10573 / BCRC 21748 / CBS 615 / JCM 9827 / NBRC 10315 / NRRL Y-1498 / VKM Y-70) TaxID=590646 RepID=G3AY79_CANTC|nr:uncharacterized protein CANTEDRAFT_96881 [Yamadazyma tenuis ATCC 10573]EGV65786.1 hypothetical protein CANTEDRAFT_96881 [Yamadazyma tenuis ATCC 10573]WEJ95889.1 RNA-binding protein pop5 [Yamadazyma tenuis]